MHRSIRGVVKIFIVHLVTRGVVLYSLLIRKVDDFHTVVRIRVFR